MDPAKDRTRSAVDNAVMHTSLVALPVLAYTGIAALTDLPRLRTAAILSLSIGLGSLLVKLLQARPTLGVVWAEFTAWIGLIFLIGSAWNALFVPLEPAVGADLGLGLIVLLLGFGVARAARHPGDSK